MATTKKTTTRKSPKTKAKPSIIARLRSRIKDYNGKRPHRFFRLTRWPRRKLGGQPVAPITQLVVGSFTTIWEERKILLGLTAVYVVVSFLAVGTMSQADFVEFKDVMVQVFQGQLQSLENALTLYSSALGGVLSPKLTELQIFMSYLIAFIFWLSIVWALRMRLANKKVKIRDALYNSSSPLISTFLVASALIAQLLPAGAALFIYIMASQAQALQGGVEYAVAVAIVALLGILSLYWVVSTFIALVMVTLPGMYPWAALSNASTLVIGQRTSIVLRVVALVLVYAVMWFLVLIPIIMLDSWLRWEWLPLVPFTMQILAGFSLTYCAVYIYKMYRSLL